MISTYRSMSPEKQADFRELLRSIIRGTEKANAELALTLEQMKRTSASGAETVSDVPAIPLVPEEVPVLRDAQAAFYDLLMTTTPASGDAPLWWTKVVYRKCGGRCVYCGNEVPSPGSEVEDKATQATIDHLIPVSIGGPHHHEAVVLACQACNSAKHMRDWIVWGKATDKKAIRALRQELSREAWNHLAPDPLVTKTKLKILAMLDARWVQPRFIVRASITAGGSFIGWKDSVGVPREITWILRHFNGKPVKENVGRGKGRSAWMFSFDRPRDALDAIWTLIERNALIRRLDLSPAFPDTTPGEDEARANWVFTSPNVGDLVRRRFSKRVYRTHSQAWKEGRVSKGADGGWVVRDSRQRA